MIKIFLSFWFATFFGVATAQHDSMFYVKVNGLSIACQKGGKGPALVLLHGGLNCNSQVWKTQFEGLQSSFTLIAWDAPGTGMSNDTPEDFGINDWADCLSGLLDSIGIKQAHVLGLSWGGLLAQVFYDRHPDHVRSLILCDTYTGWKGSLSDSESSARLTAVLHDASLSPREVASKYLPGMFGNSPSHEVKEELAKIMSSSFHPVGFRAMAKSMMADSRPLLPRIKVPALLIWGEEDKRSPIKVAEQFHDAIPGSILKIIPHAGHISNMENPAEFNRIVKDFCLSVSTK